MLQSKFTAIKKTKPNQTKIQNKTKKLLLATDREFGDKGNIPTSWSLTSYTSKYLSEEVNFNKIQEQTTLSREDEEAEEWKKAIALVARVDRRFSRKHFQ